MHSTDRIEFGNPSTAGLYFKISNLESAIALLHFISNLSEPDKNKVFQGNFDEGQCKLLGALFVDFSRAGTHSNLLSPSIIHTPLNTPFTNPYCLVHSESVTGVKRRASSDHSISQSKAKRTCIDLTEEDEDKEQVLNSFNNDNLAKKSQRYKNILSGIEFEELERLCEAIISSLINLVEQIEISQDKWLFGIFNLIIQSRLLPLINRCGIVILKNIIQSGSEVLLKECGNSVHFLMKVLLENLSQEHRESERQQIVLILQYLLAFDLDVIDKAICGAIKNRWKTLDQNQENNLETLMLLAEQIISLNPKLFNEFHDEMFSLMELLKSDCVNDDLVLFFSLIDKLVKNKHFAFVQLSRSLIHDLARRLSDLNRRYQFLMTILEIPDPKLIFHYKCYFKSFFESLKIENNLKNIIVDVFFNKILITKCTKLLGEHSYLDYLRSRIEIRSSKDQSYQLFIENIFLIVASNDQKILIAINPILTNFMFFLGYGSDEWMNFIHSILNTHNSTLILELQNQIHDYYYMLAKTPDQQKVIIAKVLSSDLDEVTTYDYYFAFKQIITTHLTRDFEENSIIAFSDYEKFLSIAKASDNSDFKVPEHILKQFGYWQDRTNFPSPPTHLQSLLGAEEERSDKINFPMPLKTFHHLLSTTEYHWFSYCPRPKHLRNSDKNQGFFKLESMDIRSLRKKILNYSPSNGVEQITKKSKQPAFLIKLQVDGHKSYKKWYRFMKDMLLEDVSKMQQSMSSEEANSNQVVLKDLREARLDIEKDNPPSFQDVTSSSQGTGDVGDDGIENDFSSLPIGFLLDQGVIAQQSSQYPQIFRPVNPYIVQLEAPPSTSSGLLEQNELDFLGNNFMESTHFEQQREAITTSTPRFMPIEEKSAASKPENSQLFFLFMMGMTRISVISVLDYQGVENILKTIETESIVLSSVLKAVIKIQNENYADAIESLKVFQELVKQGIRLPGVTQCEMSLINSTVDEYLNIAQARQSAQLDSLHLQTLS
jgi:hypothetical protein